MLAQQETELESSSWLQTLLVCGVHWQAGVAGTRCPEQFRVSQARLWRGPARWQFTGILDHNLFGCSCELELIIEPPASMGGRQVGLERKPEAPWQLGPKQNLGRNTNLKFSKVQVLVRSLVGKPQSLWLKIMWVPCLLLITCYSVYLITIKLNSISQSDQSSWKTFCESLHRNLKLFR